MSKNTKKAFHKIENKYWTIAKMNRIIKAVLKRQALVFGKEKRMKKQDVCRKYHIPVEILDEYESWGLCDVVKVVMGDWQYDDQDLERLSIIMALHDVDFAKQEIENYMRVLLEEKNSEDKLLQILEQHRGKKLDEIHFREKQLERIDYLRHEMRKVEKETKRGDQQI